jgi:transketolase
MGIRVIHVGTHDSIGLARTARPTSRSSTWRPARHAEPQRLPPADAVEVAECWKLALDARRRRR